jgi:hypothetical protein
VVTLARVAEVLGRPVETLQELDRRPFRLAFVEGAYETVVVRDRESGATLEATLDATSGDRVDSDDLRRRDRELAKRHGSTLDPMLLELLLRHPELPAIDVVVTRGGSRGTTPLRATAGEIAALAQHSDVTRIELTAEPEILD